jgi:serralysin
MAVFTVGPLRGFDLDAFDLGAQLGGSPSALFTTSATYMRSGEAFSLFGSGFSFDGQLRIVSGTVTQIIDFLSGAPIFELGGISTPAAAFAGWAANGDTEGMRQTLFAGGDTFTGGEFSDLLRAYAGNDSVAGGAGDDTLDGGGGDDSVSGGAGADSIVDGSGKNYLRGEDGDDRITGGVGFDDINGNMGNDTCVSGGGDDWVVGGRDNDSLVGSAGQNLVYGNLGNDTCDGGAGNDIVRGGQQNDVLTGGDGDDYVSGDKDSDTLTGGLGADTFHSFGDAGMDRVTDFNRAQGDRVLLDAGTTYTVAQSGADTVISMTGGAQMVLVGVQMSSLTDGWITVG